MPDDDDLTPTEGIPVDEADSDTPTQPELGQLTCPACYGQRRTLRTVDTAGGYRSIMKQCVTCAGVGLISKSVYEAWIASKREHR